MANRLQYESSPYVRQHADNPVDWYAWGDEALERARREDKPTPLSTEPGRRQPRGAAGEPAARGPDAVGWPAGSLLLRGLRLPHADLGPSGTGAVPVPGRLASRGELWR